MSERSSARSFRFHPHAGADLAEEAQYLRDDDRQVAERFEVAVTHAIERILDHPDIGRVIRESQGVLYRRWRVQRFRHSLIYAVIGDDVRIYAVAHQSRRPGYWLYRLRTS